MPSAQAAGVMSRRRGVVPVSPLKPPALPLGLPLRVQLRAGNGQCWEETYSAAGTRQNGPTRFRATAD